MWSMMDKELVRQELPEKTTMAAEFRFDMWSVELITHRASSQTVNQYMAALFPHYDEK